MKKFIVLDRDGTLIEHIPYLSDPRKVKLLSTVKKSIKKLLDNNCILFLHTNQSGISRDYFNLNDVIMCNNEMINQIGLGKNIFTDVCIAEDYPPKKKSYRKPSPKFGNEIIANFNINKSSIYYVGDSISDLETAYNLGSNAYGVNTGLVNLKSSIKNNNKLKYHIFDNLLDIVNKILLK